MKLNLQNIELHDDYEGAVDSTVLGNDERYGYVQLH